MRSQIVGIIKVSFFSLILIVAQTAFAQGGKMMPKDRSTVTMSKYSFDETVDILKGAIEEQNLMVIHVIDGQKMLRMAGKEVKGMKQIFYFHPKYMKKVMEANSEATIQIPLKFIVMERPDGKVILRYFMPSKVLGGYSGEEAIAKELDGLVNNIIKEVTS
ncbi:MAG: DUF302 domain-containing protein [bacterium]